MCIFYTRKIKLQKVEKCENMLEEKEEVHYY